MSSSAAQLRKRIGRSSRNSTKLPSSDGLPGNPGSGPELLPNEHRLHRLVCPLLFHQHLRNADA